MTTASSEAAGSGWVDGESYFRPKDLDGFWAGFGDVVTKLYATRMVFRGVKNSAWKIESSLVRGLVRNGKAPNADKVAEVEARLLSKATKWGLGFDQGRARSDTEIWALLQHHGVPTRLLDVTTDPMTALYFACEQTDAVPDDVDRGLQIFLVPDITEHPTVPWSGSDGRTYTFGWQSIQRQSEVSGKPYLIWPTNPDVRQAAQRALFLSSAVPDPSDPKWSES